MNPFDRDINADVSTCITCKETIYRTNVDGTWHHTPPHDRDHEPVPSEDK
jgi:hypothetical protein